MPINTDIQGAQYVFGFAAADAPSIANFTARSVASMDRTPEIFVTATNGEGHVEAVAISKKANKMMACEFVGYIADAFNPLTIDNTFSFLGRFFFITKISDPRPKGNFVEVSISASSYPLIES
jgi:hypothetical protein